MKRSKQLKRARKKAHHYFDTLWETNLMTRSEAYAWLAEKMHVDLPKCHMSKLSIGECERVVELVKNYSGLRKENTCLNS